MKISGALLRILLGVIFIMSMKAAPTPAPILSFQQVAKRYYKIFASELLCIIAPIAILRDPPVPELSWTMLAGHGMHRS